MRKVLLIQKNRHIFAVLINKYADMNEDSKKFLLQEKEIPEAWYNVVAEMPNKPRPMLNPATKQPLTAEDR